MLRSGGTVLVEQATPPCGLDRAAQDHLDSAVEASEATSKVEQGAARPCVEIEDPRDGDEVTTGVMDLSEDALDPRK